MIGIFKRDRWRDAIGAGKRQNFIQQRKDDLWKRSFDELHFLVDLDCWRYAHEGGDFGWRIGNSIV